MFKRILGGSVAEWRSFVAEITFFGRRYAKKVEVRIVCDANGLVSGEAYGIPFVPGSRTELYCGHIYMFEQTNWEDLDCMVKRSFMKFVSKTSPYKKLGFNKKSISSYILGTSVLRTVDDPCLPGSSPTQRIAKGPLVIRIFLKGAAQDGAIDGLAFQTHIPKIDISHYLERILLQGRIILVGPLHHSKERMESVCINLVAKSFAEFLAVVVNEPIHRVPNRITTFTSTSEPHCPSQLRDFIDDIAVLCRSTRNLRSKPGSSTNISPFVRDTFPHTVIVENLHLITDEIFEVVRGFSLYRNLTREVPFVIGTFNKSPEQQGSHNILDYGHAATNSFIHDYTLDTTGKPKFSVSKTRKLMATFRQPYPVENTIGYHFG